MTSDSENSPAGRYLADRLVDPECLIAGGLAAIHKGQRTVDPETGEPHTGVNVGAMTAALREDTRLALASEAGTIEIERHLWASAQLLQNLAFSWATGAAQAKQSDLLELYARLSLRAQNQLRQTLATLAEIRNPRRTTFIKQQNQAVNQQVLNSPVASKTGKIPNLAASELLEVVSHERVDSGTAALAVRNDAGLATVGTVYRATD